MNGVVKPVRFRAGGKSTFMSFGRFLTFWNGPPDCQLTSARHRHLHHSLMRSIERRSNLPGRAGEIDREEGQDWKSSPCMAARPFIAKNLRMTYPSR